MDEGNGRQPYPRHATLHPAAAILRKTQPQQQDSESQAQKRPPQISTPLDMSVRKTSARAGPDDLTSGSAPTYEVRQVPKSPIYSYAQAQTKPQSRPGTPSVGMQARPPAVMQDQDMNVKWGLAFTPTPSMKIETPFGPITVGECPTITISEKTGAEAVPTSFLEQTRQGRGGKEVVMPRLFRIHEMNARVKGMIAEKRLSINKNTGGATVRMVYRFFTRGKEGK